MNLIYSIASDTANGRVNFRDLKAELLQGGFNSFEYGSTEDDTLTLTFGTSVNEPNVRAIVNAHQGEPISSTEEIPKVEVEQQPAFSNPVLEDGSRLYLKIHGMKADVPALGSHKFEFTIPYNEVYLQGAEIYVDVLSQSDFAIEHPVAGILEQYGYGVVNGRYIYREKAQYASRLPMGLKITVNVTNTEPNPQEFGCNFILHEIRSPE